MKRCAWLSCIALLALCGCGNFFTKQTGSTGSTGDTGNSGGTNTGAGDVLYVADAVNSNILAYLVSTTGTLTAVTNSPYSLSTIPVSMAVTPGNNYLYVGVAAGVLGYSIGTNGVLTQLNGGTVLASDILAPTAMQVDSTGTFLLAGGIDLASGTNTAEINSYAIDASTGFLTPVNTPPLDIDTANTSGTAAPTQLYITPNNALIYVTLGTGGTEVLTFSSTNGSFADSANLPLSTNGASQNNVIANAASTLLFVTETGTGVRVFNIGTGGGLSEISGSPFAAGTGASGIALNAAGTNLYVADKGDAAISGFTVAATGTAGTLTALGSSPYTAGTLPLSLSLDQSKNFLAVANSGGTPDLGVYSFDATTAGKLDLAGSVSGSAPAGSFIVVSTH